MHGQYRSNRKYCHVGKPEAPANINFLVPWIRGETCRLGFGGAPSICRRPPPVAVVGMGTPTTTRFRFQHSFRHTPGFCEHMNASIMDEEGTWANLFFSGSCPDLLKNKEVTAKKSSDLSVFPLKIGN